MTGTRTEPSPLWLVEHESGRVVIPLVERANTAWKRALGLLACPPLAEQQALWLEPCNGIHTLGMKYALDVVFLNRDGLCLQVLPDIRPWRFCGPVRGARVVLEMPAGTVARYSIVVGRRYHLLSPSGASARVE